MFYPPGRAILGITAKCALQLAEGWRCSHFACSYHTLCCCLKRKSQSFKSLISRKW